jgi:adenylate cyclase
MRFAWSASDSFPPLDHVMRDAQHKCLGDAIMAFWGAPMDDAQHARYALLAVLEMQRAWAPCGWTTRAPSRAVVRRITGFDEK